MAAEPTEFVHVYRAPVRDAAPTLLLLHGTGGDENDLLPIGGMLDAGAGILSVRGQVLENGMPRFFRRLAMGVFDEDDVMRRASDLASFIESAAERYQFSTADVIAVGFSNGANIAAAIMWDHPSILRRAVMFRAMLPYRERDPADLSGARVLISAGQLDQMIPADSARELAARMEKSGAHVSLVWQETGHGLVKEDIAAAAEWVKSG